METPTPGPGWYQDPGGAPGQLRYYDGSHWTEHVAAPAPVPSIEYAWPPAQPTTPRTPDGRELAGWGARFGAYVIDMLIVGIITSVVFARLQTDVSTRLQDNEDRYRALADQGVLPGLDVLFNGLVHDLLLLLAGQLVIQVVYAVIFLKTNGATPGKLMLRLRVEYAASSGPLSWATALKRAVVQFVPGVVTAGIFSLVDGLWPLRDQKRQALHEKWARTQVIKLR